MKKISTLLVIAIVAISGSTYAQYAGDALRFSQSGYGSSARFKAMGGAQIGVGGDLSSLGGNPAGLGLLTKSEFNLTPGFSGMSSNISYLNQGMTTTKSTPVLGQAAVSLYLPSYKPKGTDATKGFLGMTMGLAYSRTDDFNNEYNFTGINPSNSIADYFAELGGSLAPADLPINTPEYWSYQNYLISYDPSGYYYPETFVNNKQSSADLRKGGSSELSFSAGVNISNQLYIGANVGFVSLNYTRDAVFNETGIARGYTSSGVLTGSNVDYNLKFIQTQTTTGEGLNGRIGVIFRPSPEFRLGATIQTPTWMDIEDSYTERFDNTGSTNGTNESTIYDYNYRLRTPMKASMGASYIIGGTALLTADLDYVDYTSIKLTDLNNFANGTLSADNAEIRTTYTEAVNLRVGGEYKLNNLSLRAGYAFNGSAYKNNADFNTKIISGGLGYRLNNYYLDLAYQHIESPGAYRPYLLANATEPVANINTTKNNVFLTVGVRF